MTVRQDVTRWLGVAAEVRSELGLSRAQYGDATILALIHVESGGDDEAHRDGSQFWGLLQMGALAGEDVGFEDLDKLTTRMLHGDGRRAIRAFLEYQERYSDRTNHQPTRQAALWKGGPGTMRTIRDRLNAGDSWNEALAYGEEKHGIHNLIEYVRRFTEAFQSYSVWLDDLDTPYPRLCAVPSAWPWRQDDD